MNEIEIRYKLASHQVESILKKIETLGWVPFTTNQIDTYYCQKKYYDEKRTKECPYVLRIRDEQKSKSLVYKSFTGDGSWTEIETEVSNIEAVKQILQNLGQFAYLNIKKHRKSGKLGEIEINVDEIDNLGTFVEFEIKGGNIEESKKKLASLGESLGLNYSQIIHKGYVQLYEEEVKSKS